MIVDEEKALLRINSEDNLLKKLDIIKGEESPLTIQRMPSANAGKRNIPPMVRELIGVTAALTTQAHAGEVFGVTQAGAGYSEKHHAQKRIESAHELALDAMLSSIRHVKEKLEDPDTKIKATDAAKIAADMGRVIEKTSPKEKSETKVQVLVYSPRIKLESEFEEQVV